MKDEIHSVVFATIDENGLPDARVIDIMLVDSDSLYFITARGKGFYRQLMEQKFAAVSGMTGGKQSLDKKAVSVRGKIRNIGNEKLGEVFAENSYMNEIYLSMESRNALEVFQMYEGQGEYFDLSVKPIYRDTFYLGKVVAPMRRSMAFMLRETAINAENACRNVHRTALMLQREQCRSIRRIVCIAADAMKSARRKQF